MADRDYEAEASEQGWTPKEDWKGDEAKWTDAQTFVERGEKIAGILKSRLDRQDSKIQSLQAANREFGEYHKKTIETQRKKDSERIAELEVELAAAVTDNDGPAFTKANREINDLRTELPPETNSDTAWNQLCGDWTAENKWYVENPKLNAYANGISDRLRAEGFNGQAYFTELSRRVKEDMPGEFKNPNKDKPGSVEDARQLDKTNRLLSASATRQ